MWEYLGVFSPEGGFGDFGWRAVLIILLTLAFLVILTRLLNGSVTWAGASPIQWKAPKVVGNALYPAGVVAIRGKRPHMEDKYNVVRVKETNLEYSFYGVFDGHGGVNCPNFTAQKLPDLVYDEFKKQGRTRKKLARAEIMSAIIKGFRNLDAQYVETATANSWNDGTTAVTCFIVNEKGGKGKKSESVLYVANTGDSRAVLVTKDGCQAMSDDHKPNREDEKRRIEERNGRVIRTFGGIWRVEGVLAVSRAIGDRLLKKWVIPDPEIKYKSLKAADVALVLASDGVWDVVDNEQVATVVRERFNDTSIKGSGSKDAATIACEQAARKITHLAYQSGSCDNISTFVIDLRPYGQPNAPSPD